MKKKIIWIASFPKSGNTWVRYLISNYFYNLKKKFDFNIINNIRHFPEDNHLTKLTNRSELVKNPYEVSKYWIKAQENLKIKSGNTIFLKTHNALVSINNHSFTDENHSLAAIYIVRDPRDVVVSYSNYSGQDYDQIIQHMISKKLVFRSNEKSKLQIPEITGSWKFHYDSWKTGVPKMPRILVRYEDLLNNTKDEFIKIIQFLSKIITFEINHEKISSSIDNSNFKTLSSYEKVHGFDENYSKKNFFHKGRAEQWKKKLSLYQIETIESEFKKEMSYLKYLK